MSLHPLYKFLSWLSFLIFICFIGISNVMADEYLFDYNYVQIYYNNNGSSLSTVGQSWNESLQAYVSNSIPTTANSYGAGVAFNSPVPIIANHTYTMSFYFLERSNIALSSKNHIAVGNSAYNAAISHYANSSYYATTQYSNVSNASILSFVFKPTTNGQWIFVPWTTTSNANQTYVFQSVIIDDLGDSGVSQAEINTSLSNQTNTINNYITNSTNTITNNSNSNRDAIINNQNANRDAIINNQNENTQQQIESQQVCKTISKNNIKTDGYLQTNGVIENNDWAKNYFGITDYLITKNSTFRAINIYNNSSSAFCFYDNDYNLLSCSANNTMTENGLITVPTGSSYVRFSIYKVQDVPRVTYCGNGNQALNDSVNNLNDSINNDDTGDANNDTASFITGFNTNTFGLTSIITAPLNLIQSLTSSTCTPLHLPLPYLNNKYLDLPCMNTIYSQHFGTFFSLYQTITYGIIAYWVCVRIFNHVKDFKNPEHDEIEVVDL